MKIDDNINFNAFFYPKTIAMIGATPSPGKWGFIIMMNIIKGGYTGRLFPVNPGYREIFGLPCFPSVNNIEEEVDLAIIAVPAANMIPAIDDCIKKSISSAVVITSGFSETGAEGTMLEKEMVEKASRGGLRIIGPNTMGLFSAQVSLTALMPPVTPLKGKVSMISQSGNVGTQILGWGREMGVGFDKFVSSGNEGDIKCEDYLRYLGSDSQTEVIVLYLESLEEGKTFLDIARDIVKEKPIIVFKGGKTDSGMAAAASHTGAMAGSINIYQSAFRQTGLIEVSSTEEIIDTAGAFLSYPIPMGNRIGILTRGGGWGVITADACEASGLQVPKLPEEVIKKIDEILPQYWSRGNPVDMVAVITSEPYLKCLEILMSCDVIDGIISLGGALGESFGKSISDPNVLSIMGLSQEDVTRFRAELAAESSMINKTTKELMEKYKKPIVNVSIGGGKRTIEEHKFITYPTPERAVRVMKYLVEYGDYLRQRNLYEKRRFR
ncbi:MAG: CoA-binding protein [Deltaproteobacteria bacterium]|nr:CoA-binding protein [Deltaproteobacteria bacterium]